MISIQRLLPSLAFITITLGVLVSFVVAFQESPAVKAVEPWYHAPAFTAAAVAGLLMLVVKVAEKIVDAYREGKKDKDKKKDDHLSYSVQMEELTAKEWVDAINHRNSLHAREVDFHQNQLITSEVNKYEVKERLNRAMSELTAVQNYTMKLKGLLIKCGSDFEDLPIKSYGEIMSGIEDKVVEYEENMKKRYHSDKDTDITQS